MCKWRIRRKCLAKKVPWGGGGGSWELQDLSSFVLGENYLCILYENIQEAFSNVLETLEFWIIQSILSPHYLSVRLDRCKLTTLIFPS